MRTMTGMKQIALDIGLASVASFTNFFAGSNEAALKHNTNPRPPLPTPSLLRPLR